MKSCRKRRKKNHLKRRPKVIRGLAKIGYKGASSKVLARNLVNIPNL